MRRWIALVGGAALLTASVLPAHATTVPVGPYNVRLSSGAGAPGSEVVVTGSCAPIDGPATVVAQLQTGAGSSSTAYSTSQTAEFTLRLPVPPVPVDPMDLEVSVECHGYRVYLPFTVTTRTTQQPTLFASIEPLTCGDPAGCGGRVKGLASNGAMSNLNVAAGGGSLAAGELRNVGRVVAAGAAPGRYTDVRVVPVADPYGGSYLSPFGDFYGGVNVAFGDIDGDGSDELITGAGPGGGPHVKVFRYNPNNWWEELLGFFAYDPSMGSGVTVAAADLDRDGRDEIVTGTGAGAGPHVRVFRGTGQPTGVGFFAYDPGFRGGVNVAASDVTEGSAAEIVTGTGPGGGPHVRVFRSTGEAIGAGFYAYDPGYLGGVSVAAGDVSPFGRDEIVTAPFQGGGPHVRIFTADGATDGPGFFAFSIAPRRTTVAAVHR